MNEEVKQQIVDFLLQKKASPEKVGELSMDPKRNQVTMWLAENRLSIS